jgi:hypothetical protein
MDRMTQDGPRFSPVIALLAVSAMWEEQLASILKDLGISTRKFGLLGHIYAEPGISFSELARRSHITVQSAHTAVRTLVDDGLVQDATAHAGAASDLHVTAKERACCRMPDSACSSSTTSSPSAFPRSPIAGRHPRRHRLSARREVGRRRLTASSTPSP